ncbi:hypothetical protein WEI85_07145 [Actinomycetes bacterium KLBMP 9797]
MNKWFYRAVGSVGVAAGGFLLLGGGAAQAEDVDATPASDPLDLRGALDDFFTPVTGLNAGNGDIKQIKMGGQTKGTSPDIMMRGQMGGSDLVGDVSPTRDLGFVGEAPSSPTAAINPAMLGGGEAVAKGKPALISSLPVAGTFTDTIGASRAVDATGIGGTSNAVLNGGNGLGLNASRAHDLVPATSDVDPTRIGPAVPASLGMISADAIPTVATHKAVKGNTKGFVRSTTQQGQNMAPAVIGDAMVAQNPELFQPEAAPTVGSLPVLSGVKIAGVPTVTKATSTSPLDSLGALDSLGSLSALNLPGTGANTLPAPAADEDPADKRSKPRPHARTAGERPVAGEDADYTEAASVGLPLIGDLGNLTRMLPTGGSLAGAPAMKHMDV